MVIWFIIRNIYLNIGSLSSFLKLLKCFQIPRDKSPGGISCSDIWTLTPVFKGSGKHCKFLSDKNTGSNFYSNQATLGGLLEEKQNCKQYMGFRELPGCWTHPSARRRHTPTLRGQKLLHSGHSQVLPYSSLCLVVHLYPFSYHLITNKHKCSPECELL